MRRRVPWRVAVGALIVAAAAVAVACSSFDSSDTEQSEAGVPETGPAADAPANDAADAAPRFFCTGAEALFCDDFDQGALGDTWTGNASGEGGTLQLVSNAKSPPNALLGTVSDLSGTIDASAEAASDMPMGQAILLKNLARDNLNGVAVDFELRLDHVPGVDAGSVAVVATVTFDFNQHSASVIAVPDGLALFVANPTLPGGSQQMPVAVPSGTGFFHVRLEVSFDGTGTRVFVNGARTALSESVLPQPGGFYVAVGPLVLHAVEETKVAFDNVVVTAL